MNKYKLVVDTETTGLKTFTHDIIAIGAIILDEKNEIIDSFKDNAQPQSFDQWTESAEAIHKISKFDAARFKTQKEMVIDMMKWIKPYKHENNYPMEFISHSNGAFDFRFLEAAYTKLDLYFSFTKILSREKHTSTIQLAKEKIPSMENYKLSTLANYFSIELNHHEAMSDAIACAKIYKNLKDNF